jgi:histidinol dehydrogenase
MTRDPEVDAAEIRSAGSVYVGPWAPESAGDYATGANHVLPTGGLARACGPLSVTDFGSWRQVQRIDRGGLERIAPTISALATAEGLTAHRLAAEIRLEIDRETA